MFGNFSYIGIFTSSSGSLTDEEIEAKMALKRALLAGGELEAVKQKKMYDSPLIVVNTLTLDQQRDTPISIGTRAASYALPRGF